MVLYTHHLFATKISQELLLCLGITVTATVSGPLPFYFSLALLLKLLNTLLVIGIPSYAGVMTMWVPLHCSGQTTLGCQPHMTYDC